MVTSCPLLPNRGPRRRILSLSWPRERHHPLGRTPMAARGRRRAALGSPIAWPELFTSGITCARDGFAPSRGQRRETADADDLFGAAAPAELRAPLWRVYHPALLARERFVQSELAATLEEIARGGAETFYRGALGRRIAQGAAAAGSPLTPDDLAAHRAQWV